MLKSLTSHLIKAIKILLAWMIGIFLFGFILLKLLYSWILRLIQQIFNVPGLYQFRERQFELMKINSNEKEEHISLGKFSFKNLEVLTFFIPNIREATEVLLEIKLDKFDELLQLELEYCIFNKFVKEHFYFFINTMAEFPGLNYNIARCWFPISDDNSMNAQLTGLVSNQFPQNITAELFLIKWR